MDPGDVVVVIKIKPHKTFQRKGADLLIEKDISLLEALTGVDFVVKHLDGRDIRIKNKPGQVIKPNSMMTCEGLGMPFHKTPYEFGNLFVLFKVKFPEKVSAEQIGKFNEVLSSVSGKTSDPKDLEGIDEVCELKKFDES